VNRYQITQDIHSHRGGCQNSELLDNELEIIPEQREEYHLVVEAPC
jgi:hypothetical protein